MAQSRQGGTSAGETHGHFFFFGSRVKPASASTDVWHIGGGGEAAVLGRFGIGTEVGGIPHGTAGGTVTVLSANGFYHPLGQHHRWFDPYATAGISGLLYNSNQRAARPNAGAGVNCWLPRRHDDLAVGVEVRDVPAPAGGFGFLEVRLQIRVWQ